MVFIQQTIDIEYKFTKDLNRLCQDIFLLQLTFIINSQYLYQLSYYKSKLDLKK